MWVKRELRKPISANKLQAVVSSRKLALLTQDGLARLGITPCLHGEMLGIDCSMGGQMRRRPIQRKRASKAKARRRRLRWWRKLSGKAMPIARAGPRAELMFGSEVVGLPNGTLCDLRRVCGAATRIHCGGSSLTARLAVGGDKWAEADPAVLDAGLPLFCVLCRLWDDVSSRAHFVFMWNHATQQVMKYGETWSRICGTVGAALLSVLRVDAQWLRPFVLELLDVEVNLLTTPPLQVLEIFKAHSRRCLDRELVNRITKDWGAEHRQAAQSAYRHGIAWASIRKGLAAAAKSDAFAARALEAVVCGGFWPEERRHAHGLREDSWCTACRWEVGSARHRLHDCGALHSHLLWLRVAGQYYPPVGSSATDLGHRLLQEYGWPPVEVPWEPVEGNFTEGDFGAILEGDAFGDGSGYNQASRETRISTWSVIRTQEGDDDGHRPLRYASRGTVTGWFPTVHRAELTALINCLKSAVIPARYIGDCAATINGARSGVGAWLTGSRSMHADLWREVKFHLDDHGEGISVAKTKAHRSRRQAENDTADPIEWWIGNQHADSHAKDLARSLAAADSRAVRQEAAEEVALNMLSHLALAAKWCFSSWPEGKRGLKPPRAKHKQRAGDVGECGGHTVQRITGGGWRCRSCLLETWGDQGLGRLSRRPCDGAARDRAHRSHFLSVTRGVLWCTRCAAHTTRVPRTLLAQCRGRPRNVAYANYLKRLRLGLMPTRKMEKEEADRGGPLGRIEGSPPRGNGADGGAGICSSPVPANMVADNGRMSERRDRRARAAEQASHSDRLLVPTPSRDDKLQAEAVAAASAVRRRINQKSRPSASAFAAVRDARCNILIQGRWISRVVCTTAAAPSPCTACVRPARSRCRGCSRSLCLSCARAQRPCGVVGGNE